ncbi:hypothetical protein DFW61_08990 [Campylobacter coli]|nr:hypothetical protein [Campylobacter coli]
MILINLNLLICSFIVFFLFIIGVIGFYYVNDKRVNDVYFFAITPLISILILWCLLVTQVSIKN